MDSIDGAGLNELSISDPNCDSNAIEVSHEVSGTLQQEDTIQSAVNVEVKQEKFEPFLRLPVEIQLKIWKANLNISRLITFTQKIDALLPEKPSTKYRQEPLLITQKSTSRQHPVLYVTRRVRRELLQQFHLVFGTRLFLAGTWDDYVDGTLDETFFREEKFWFNMNSDILYFSTKSGIDKNNFGNLAKFMAADDLCQPRPWVSLRYLAIDLDICTKISDAEDDVPLDLLCDFVQRCPSLEKVTGVTSFRDDSLYHAESCKVLKPHHWLLDSEMKGFGFISRFLRTEYGLANSWGRAWGRKKPSTGRLAITKDGTRFGEFDCVWVYHGVNEEKKIFC